MANGNATPLDLLSAAFIIAALIGGWRLLEGGGGADFVHLKQGRGA